MYVPNYMPGPIEVPGNVTTERYATRLVFIRRVIWLHLGSMAMVAVVMGLPLGNRGITPIAWSLVGFILLLEVIRIRTRGRPEEPWLSCAFFAPVLGLVAALLREMQTFAHLPVWAFFVGPPCVALYSAVCGRDFSFVGGFFLSLILSDLLIAGISLALQLSSASATWALAANSAYLFYWVYDLAALLARRRMGEEPAAVVDLYRDVFNIFGYVPRVITHWKKHQIWVAPVSPHRTRED